MRLRQPRIVKVFRGLLRKTHFHSSGERFNLTELS